MRNVRQFVQFMLGLTMMVGGVAALAPIAAELAAETARDVPQEPVARRGTEPSAVSGHAIPDAGAGLAGTVATIAPEPEAAVRPPREMYQPPAVPTRLPTSYPGIAPESPALTGAYRSSFTVPPPPLLDPHGTPPVAPGWGSRGLRQPAQAAPSAAPDLPATYVVRDGDDLTTLAIRLYGQPAAAAAILAANRDRITDPAILPIGLALRLPPPWTITGGRPASGGQAIEPGPGGNRVPAEPRASAIPAAVSRSWMSPSDARP